MSSATARRSSLDDPVDAAAVRSPALGSAVAAWRTGLLVARSDGRRSRQTFLLSAAAAATSLLVALVALGITSGTWERATPPEWRSPVLTDQDVRGEQGEAGETGTGGGHSAAVPGTTMAVSTSQADGEVLTVARFAVEDGAPPVVPAGVAALPRPGEVIASPALVALASSLPQDELAARFPGSPQTWGVLGDAALSTPDELVAFVGVAPGDASLSAPQVADPRDPVAEPLVGVVTGYSAPALGDLSSDSSRTLAALGCALLLVPVLVLAAAGGRLAGSRRELVLARLRLAGASPRQVTLVVAAETAVAAVAGALAGTAAYLALLPLVARVPWQGHPWFVGDLLPSPGLVLAAVALVVVVLVAAALSTLHAVITSPLGAAQLQDARSTRLGRLVLAVVAVGATAYAARASGELVVQLATVVVVVGALNLVGPFVVDRLGRVLAAVSRGPAGLLAGRSLSGDPRGGWRVVSGVVLAGFAAGFFSLVAISPAADGVTARSVLLPVPAGEAQSVLAEAEKVVDDGAETTLAADPTALGLFVGPEVAVVQVTVPAGAAAEAGAGGGTGAERSGSPGTAALDRAVTALDGLVPGQPATVAVPPDSEVGEAMESMRTLMLGVLALTYVLALVSTALTSVASLAERREEHRSLRTMGASLAVVRRARTMQTLVPLLVLSVLSTLAGAAVAWKVNQLLHTTADPAAPAALVLFVATGAVLMYGVLRVTGRGLASSTTPEREPATV